MTLLREAVAEARSCSQNPPPTESTTCHWVIYPLLQAIGYQHQEIISQDLDSAGQFPDFKILPDSPRAWYLEAKAWKIELADKHVNQALNYANQNKGRWVVLTNGRDWRLYDNQLFGLAGDKLAVCASIKNAADLEALLLALRKDSVIGGGVELFARRGRLARLVLEQAVRSDSDLVKAVWNALKKQPGLEGLTREEITGVLRPLAASAPAGVESPLSAVAPAGSEVADVTVGQDAGRVPLGLPYGDAYERTRGKKPQALITPDGASAAVSSWADVAAEIVGWLGRHESLPSLPFNGAMSGNYLLNTEPRHASKKMASYREVPIGKSSVFVQTTLIGADVVHQFGALVRLMGLEPDTFSIQLGPAGR